MGKCIIVAEMSANHGGSKQLAIETIKAAKRAGADAIKMQTYTADTITLDCDAPDFIINEGSIWDGRGVVKVYILYIIRLIHLGSGTRSYLRWLTKKV